MTLARFTQPLAAALFLVSLCAAPAAAQPGKYDSYFVFGDSLADNGNVWLTSKVLAKVNPALAPAPPPSETPHATYWNGRFSNGPVFVEQLWSQVRHKGAPKTLLPYISSPVIKGKAAVNFAFGGTGTPLLDQTPGGLQAPGLLGQVELFRVSLLGKKPSASALYLIATGANDYRIDPYNTPMAPEKVVANIALAVQRLYAIGARHIVVMTLPDLGCIPSENLPVPQAHCTAPASNDPTSATPPSQLTAYHNMLLAQALANLKLSGATLRLVDLNEKFAELRNTAPGSWFYPALVANGTPELASCLFTAPATCRDVDFAVGNGFLFWDVVHPTSDGHAALAQFTASKLGK